MSLENISMKKLAIIAIAGGVIAIFFISGFQVREVIFPQSFREEVQVLIKNEDGACVVEPSDRIPRTISNCQYDEGDTVMVTYNANQPMITSHELLRKGEN
jgi:hypothetical protein